MEIPGPPLPLASWLSPQTVPTATPPLATPACHCNTEVGPKMTLPQMPGCYYYIIPGNTPEPGSTNATAPAPGPTPAPNPGPATAPSHLQPRDTHGGNPNLHRATRFGEQAPVSLPPSAPLPSMFQSEAVLTCKSVVFWMEVSTIISKLAAGGWERLQHTQLYKRTLLEHTLEHIGYLPDVSVLPYALSKTTSSILLTAHQQTLWSHVWNSDESSLFTYLMEIWDS
ncbi:hypothetical protein DUI87_02622 [Hirundo rustica rustica]|uniref:Uncharacterized protein n=1 Tax=Hirundo rustica rustica TaxID=333673 RepID=A0A3M0L8W7_HIRRU|nr:hypothetical protein DUI87_02622 [Hirundo rustica rustica]